ncbi:hypothetical protein [Nostoc sp.]|uniref:hypothetical protein n=1 Tax=Nostoc sp. TaxID=1180 RepID=UPI002FF8F7F3
MSVRTSPKYEIRQDLPALCVTRVRLISSLPPLHILLTKLLPSYVRTVTGLGDRCH